ncbi:hypothetical protein B0T22DRAFT_229156 [Podospora appendiculata]|uniref:Uncharacterized protein n=1 Tax=Podospora appendiculata TaxID=314037 RepID=A0AAE0X696_9PEZI|nr:hypothetical protein B0T22DRAFT_229156 [Podospora appendiculata]
MIATMSSSVFSFVHDTTNTTASSLYRPTRSSPLSSSPIGAAPASPPFASSPLSARDSPSLFSVREAQSSPISAPPSTGSVSRFKYATRNARPNPVVQKREDVQDGRRRLFLNNVRQRADEKKWERRGGENELLKLEWQRLNRELRSAKNSDLEGVVMEEEIEDEPQLHALRQELAGVDRDMDMDVDADAMMVDAIEQQEQAEIDALLLSIPLDTTSSQARPDSPQHFSDDDDYDSIFMDLLSSQRSEQAFTLSQDVDMS